MLADWALWTTQDEYTGALHTSRRVAGLIVAAAVLAELVGQKAIRVTSKRVEPTGPAAATGRLVTASRTVARSEARPAGERGSRHRIPMADPLSAEVLVQLARDPDLTPGEVIEALATDIRERVARRLIAAGAAHGRRRRRFQRQEVVAVAPKHDLRPASASIAILNKILHGDPLTGEERFVMHLLAHSSLSHTVLGHDPDRIRDALGPVHTTEVEYRPLLTAAITLLHDAALAR